MQAMNRMPKLPQMNVCVMQKAESNIHQIYLYDDIEEYGEFNWSTWNYEESETSAKYIRDALQEIPDDAEIELYINSNGGSVKEGTAIFNMLKRHPAKKTGYVDGVAHSIAFIIFQACDYRIMGEGTSALLHEMWLCMCGNAEQLRKEADQLDTLMRSNRQLLMQRAKDITEDELAQMMRDETMLTPDTALKYGFCDEIAQREKQPKPIDGAQNSVRELREKFQRNTDFENELKDFEETCKPKQKEPEQQEESTDIMSAFFNAFL